MVLEAGQDQALELEADYELLHRVGQEGRRGSSYVSKEGVTDSMALAAADCLL